MRNVDKLWFVLSILIGIIIGQVTTSMVIHPDVLLEQGIVLGANAYWYGCTEAHGTFCLHRATLYREQLEKVRLFEPNSK